MQTLVTGGAGFIGSTLVDRLLRDGHRVVAIDDLSTGSLANLADARQHSSFRFVEGDVRTTSTIDVITDAAPEVIFHLAAQPSVTASVRDAYLDAEVNILGTLRVLDGAVLAKTRKVVFAASGGTLYGPVDADELPVDESRPHRPTSPYGISKKTAIDYLVSYKLLRGLDFTALALANIFGPRQDPHGEAGVVAIFSGNLANGATSAIYGDGEQTRDFVYVDDVVDAFVRAASHGSSQVINIGTGLQTSVNELYRLMAEASSSPLQPTYLPERDGDLKASALDPTSARATLGWNPAFSVKDGLGEVIARRTTGTAR